MKKANMSKNFYLVFLFIFVISSISAQNCTVNAGVDRQICINQSMNLVGFRNGLLKPATGTLWTQISGPSVTITNPNNTVTTVTGFSVGNTYTFRLSATCRDGIRAFDDVRFTVVGITQANAGSDQTVCSGSGTLNGNAPGVNETGQWLVVSANNAGVTIANPTNRNSSFTTSATGSGTTTLRWRIANTNGCSSSDIMVITNYGGRTPVVTNKLIRLDSCYTTTHCANLLGSYGGNGIGGQIGTWSQLSGPTSVTFWPSVNDSSVYVCNLVQGRYRFRWTVAGPCVNGSDTVLVIVPNSTQSLTGVSSNSLYFCSGQTSASLSGTVPLYSGETITWTQTSGPGGVTIATPNSPNTLVTGLDGVSSYTFNYNITNTNTNCTGSSTSYITYISPPSINFRDTLLPCNVEELTIPINGSGGLNMYYRIATAPPSWGTTPTSYSDITGATSLTVNGLNVPGDYVIDVQRTSPSGIGCFNASKSFKVTVSKPVVGANAGTDQFLACNIDSTRLAGNIVDTAFFGTWTLVSGPGLINIDSIHLNNSFIQGAPDFVRGRYRFRWTVSGGPKCTKASDDVFLYFAPSIPTPVDAGPDRSVCYGPIVQLSGTPVVQGETGQWTVSPSAGVTIVSPNDGNTNVTGLSPSTVYNFKWKKCNTCGCDSSIVTITTTNTLGPPAANAGIDQCLSAGTTSTTLAATNPSPSSGKWVQLTGPSASITNDTLYNTTVTALTDSNYSFEWRTIRGTCDPLRDTMIVTVKCSSPPSNAGPDRDSCGNSITMSANTPPYGIGTWIQVSGPAGWSVTDIHSPTARFTGLEPGSYEFTWRIQNGIAPPSNDNVRFNIDIQPSTPEAGTGVKICNSTGVVTLSGNALTNVSSTAWSMLSPAPNTPNIVSPMSQTTQVTGMIAGIYKFRYTAYSIMGICPAKFDDVEDTLIFNANAGRDTGFCDTGSYTLVGTLGSTGTWTKLSGGSATLTTVGNNTAILSNAGSAGSPYKFIYSIPSTFGCPPTVDTVTIVYSDTSSLPNAGADQQICNANTITLNGNSLTAPSVGLWTFLGGPNTPSITNPSNSNTTVTGTVPGIYLFNWLSTNSYCRVQDQVKINIDAAPSLAAAGSDRTLCPDSVKLNASLITSGTGLWSQIAGPNTSNISNTSDPKTPVTNLTQGTYRYEWRVISGVCPPNIDTVQINVPDLKPTSANAGLDSAICNRTVTKLNGNSPTIGIGTWQQITGPSSTIANNLSNNSNLTLSSNGNFTYVWNIVNGICSSRDTVNYTMSLPPTTSNAGRDTIICIYGSYQLTGNNPSVGTGTWIQVAGPSTLSFTNPNLYNSEINGLIAGNYNLNWIITNGSCPNSIDNMNINTLEPPSFAAAGASQKLCGPLTTLTGSANTVGTPLWQTVSGPNVPVFSSANSNNTNVTNLLNGVYKFRYSITNATCVDADTLEVNYLNASPNDKCLDAKILLHPNPIAIDSLCGARALPGEPITCGFAPCNSLYYKFTTNPSLWYKDMTFDLTSIGSCSNGLRITLFKDGACPNMGAQIDTCRTISSPGSRVFRNLAPSTNYYMVIDENTAICTYSKCNYSFQILGEPLPLSDLNIEASLNSFNITNIKWKSVNEPMNNDYVIERSTDGINYSNIGKVKSKNLDAYTVYQLEDNVNDVISGRIYYRVKEVNKDGKINYSNTVSVYKKHTLINKMIVSPNPGTGNYKVSLNSGEDTPVKFNVINSQGQVIIHNELTMSKGFNQFEIDLSQFADGIYNIQIISNDNIISEKLIMTR